MSSIQYRSEIDGLRALAVIPVILFHINNEILPGGYIGVDIFFVISGFLITSIILNEYKRGIFSFSNFWMRRIMRILPVLITVVFMTLITGRIILYGPDINNLGNQGIAALLSFANISHWLLAGDYWGFTAESSPLLHTWSLSVEEQFYLFFPLFMIITLKYLHRWIGVVFIIFTLLSISLFLVGTQMSPAATFYLLPTRAWELGAGAILSIIFFKKNLQFTSNNILAIVGFLLIILSYFFIGDKGGISPFLVIPVFGAVLIIAFTKDSNSIINKILSMRPVTYIGKISYSLYLWHWPILVLSRQYGLKHNLEINYMYISIFIFILSVLSYHFIETYTRKNRRAIPYILFFLVVNLIFSYTLKISKGTTTAYSKTEWHGQLYNVQRTEWPEFIRKRMKGIDTPEDTSIDTDIYTKGGIIKLYGKNTPDIVLFGDSHAIMWSRVIDESAKELNASISFYGADGIPTFFNIPVTKKKQGSAFLNAEEMYVFEQAKLNYLKKWKPKIIIISSYWSGQNQKLISELMLYIREIGSKVLLIEDPPVLYFGDKNTPKYLSSIGLAPAMNFKQYVKQGKSAQYKIGLNLIENLSKKYDFIETIHVSDIFLHDEKVLVIDSYDVLYIDDDHLSYKGSLKAKNRIITELKKHL